MFWIKKKKKPMATYPLNIPLTKEDEIKSIELLTKSEQERKNVRKRIGF